MARLHIDTCAMSQEWARDVLSAAKDNPNVIFVESRDWKSEAEKGRMVKLISFLKGVQEKYGLHRVEFAPKKDVEAHIKKIERVDAWNNCSECDDPHVFAIVSVKSVHFVLTNEKRMETCRKKMQGKLDQRYLAFRLINSQRNYIAHQVGLFSSL